MRSSDLADSPLASYRPDFAAECDSLADRLREAVAPFVALAQRVKAFAAMDEVLEQSDLDTGPGDKAQSLHGIFKFLRVVYGDTRLPSDIRRQACAAAIGANDPFFDESYQHYADKFCVTRASIHADAREVQKRFGLRARRDKSDGARAKSRDRASGLRRPSPRNPRRLLSLFPGL